MFVSRVSTTDSLTTQVNINVVKWTRADGCEQSAACSPEAPPTAATATSTTDGVMRPTQSVFVANTLRPRDVARLDPRTRRVQLPGRTLWLSLHGEAHFRSLRLREGSAIVKSEEAASGARVGQSGFLKLEEEASAGMGLVSVEVKTELREVMSPSWLPDGVSRSSGDVGETERGRAEAEVTAPAMATASGVVSIVGDVRTGVSNLESSGDLMGASERAPIVESLSGGEASTGVMQAAKEVGGERDFVCGNGCYCRYGCLLLGGTWWIDEPKARYGCLRGIFQTEVKILLVAYILRTN